jgi:hypothetical protein
VRACVRVRESERELSFKDEFGEHRGLAAKVVFDGCRSFSSKVSVL